MPSIVSTPSALPPLIKIFLTAALRTTVPPAAVNERDIACVSMPLPPLGCLAPLVCIMACQPKKSPAPISSGGGPDCAPNQVSAARIASDSNVSVMSWPYELNKRRTVSSVLVI